MFNQKVIHSFNPVIIPSSSFRNVLVIKMSTWKTNNLKVLSYWRFTNYISKLHLSIINIIYCIVINGLREQQKKNNSLFSNKKRNIYVYILLTLTYLWIREKHYHSNENGEKIPSSNKGHQQ